MLRRNSGYAVEQRIRRPKVGAQVGRRGECKESRRPIDQRGTAGASGCGNLERGSSVWQTATLTAHKRGTACGTHAAHPV